MSMISLKPYLEAKTPEAKEEGRGVEGELLRAAVAALRESILAMVTSGRDACAATADALESELGEVAGRIEEEHEAARLRTSGETVALSLRKWGENSAAHYREKTGEVKQMLLLMARAADSVRDRTQRSTGELTQVTAKLECIATLDDLSQVRALIEASAAELKTSVGRIESEGKAAVEHLSAEVVKYRTRLEEAEEAASRDGLTRLNNRAWIEEQLGRRMETSAPLSVAVVDVNGFKKINDEHGHLVGDELLRQFAGELRSACRKGDLLARWGGDEFLLALNSPLEEAQTQVERLRHWVCGSYKLRGRSGALELKVDAAIGVAEKREGEKLVDLLGRADEAMYEQKAGMRHL
jgi:diguanylate cyclase (GGDEF)-like protein